mmetsp:Transcript_10424/g.24321  ORF Transcript_10424/g.24321 Transcript_10424/m.24321 type:complete len:242 (+) Transcript_10424:204-929(+)
MVMVLQDMMGRVQPQKGSVNLCPVIGIDAVLSISPTNCYICSDAERPSEGVEALDVDHLIHFARAVRLRADVSLDDAFEGLFDASFRVVRVIVEYSVVSKHYRIRLNTLVLLPSTCRRVKGSLLCRYLSDPMVPPLVLKLAGRRALALRLAPEGQVYPPLRYVALLRDAVQVLHLADILHDDQRAVGKREGRAVPHAIRLAADVELTSGAQRYRGNGRRPSDLLAVAVPPYPLRPVLVVVE